MSNDIDPRAHDKSLLYDDLEALYAATGSAKIPNGKGGTYWPKGFLRKVRNAHADAGRGVAHAVAELVRTDTTGFDVVAESGHYELLVEYLVLDESKSYHDLFGDETKLLARDRLRARGFPLPGAASDAVDQGDPAVFLLTWNSDRWAWDRNALGRWSVGNRRTGIRPGDLAFLLRQGRRRGLIASGIFTSGVFQAPHWDGSGDVANFAQIEWDTVIDPVEDPDGALSTQALVATVPGIPWDNLLASGVKAAHGPAMQLVALWRQFAGEAAPVVLADEEATEGPYVEGARTRVMVNRFERDARARQACLRLWGARCWVCDLDFAERYGDYARGIVHVHHLVPLGQVGGEYVVDPVQDLRPVCPNCHAAIHRPGAPAIDAMRADLHPEVARRAPTKPRPEPPGP